MPAASSLPWWQRPRFWAVVLALVVVAINLASMASTGAWDPWETHYGEVARNILVRHDPLDLWWQAGNGGPDAVAEKTFWSKPALPFWLMALSMKIFGVGTSGPPDELVQPFWPEFAIRLPSMLAGLGSAALLGYVAWRQVSPRAGILTAAVLVTMPQFAVATRQALTDMIFVGPVVLAAAAWILAWGQPDRPLRRRGQGARSLPWDRAYLAFAIVFAAAVVAPLAVIHQHAYDPYTWATVGKNPGHAASLRQIQSHMFIYWGLVVLVLGLSLRWTRRSQVWMGVLYIAAGLSLLGKGLIGPGLVGAVVLVHLVVTGRWDLLRRCGLPTGIVLFALASFPWHHAMVLFRGERWVNELIIQNNLARFDTGEQKQAVGSFAFYLETLGLAALPWSAVVPLVLAAAFGIGRKASAPAEATSEASEAGEAGEAEAPASASTEASEATSPAGEAGEAGEAEAPDFQDFSLAPTPEAARRVLHQFALIWFSVALFAIGYSVTKYYHYLIPVLPPLALLVGLWIDQRMSGPRTHVGPRLIGVAVGLAVLVAVVRDTFHSTAWLAHLTTYLYTGMWRTGGPEVSALPWLVLPFGLGLLAWALGRHRAALAGFVLSGLLTTGWAVDDYLPAASENWSQRSALRLYFAERGPRDRLVSWWFYYRGETWFSKQDVWVMKDVDRKALTELFDQVEGQDTTLWFITIEPHARRLAAQVPQRYRGDIEEVYKSFHYTLLRVHVP
ncbi:MAG: glycosyltransferase family 39 protein [Myxococcales bacterium]|nr:glycosyltransferase family 39 protein [Myxococcales bacterium]